MLCTCTHAKMEGHCTRRAREMWSSLGHFDMRLTSPWISIQRLLEEKIIIFWSYHLWLKASLPEEWGKYIKWDWTSTILISSGWVMECLHVLRTIFLAQFEYRLLAFLANWVKIFIMKQPIQQEARGLPPCRTDESWRQFSESSRFNLWRRD